MARKTESRYQIEPVEFGPEGKPEVFCVLLNGCEVGPYHGSEQEAKDWIELERMAQD